jgi:hypothetical protein
MREETKVSKISEIHRGRPHRSANVDAITDAIDVNVVVMSRGGMIRRSADTHRILSTGICSLNTRKVPRGTIIVLGCESWGGWRLIHSSKHGVLRSERCQWAARAGLGRRKEGIQHVGHGRSERRLKHERVHGNRCIVVLVTLPSLGRVGAHRAKALVDIICSLVDTHTLHGFGESRGRETFHVVC